MRVQGCLLQIFVLHEREALLKAHGCRLEESEDSERASSCRVNGLLGCLLSISTHLP